VAAHAAGELLTTLEFARRLEMSPQALNRHLTDLVTHGWLMADRRTPVPAAMERKGGKIPPGADSTDWAAIQITPDRTCALLLPALARAAGGRWAGQTTMAELAKRSGIPTRTVERHRPHLGTRAGAGLVQFIPDTVLSSNGRHRVRRGDHFRFLAGRDVRLTWGPSESLADPREFEAAARALVDSVRWYVGPPADFEQAYRRVAVLLARGHRPEVLHRDLTTRTPDSGIPPYRVLSNWLPSLDDRPMIPAGPVGNPRCTSCRVRMRPSPDGLCRECREDGTLPVTSMPERQFAAFPASA
jgi:hypothetical protein